MNLADGGFRFDNSCCLAYSGLVQFWAESINYSLDPYLTIFDSSHKSEFHWKISQSSLQSIVSITSNILSALCPHSNSQSNSSRVVNQNPDRKRLFRVIASCYSLLIGTVGSYLPQTNSHDKGSAIYL
jgi:hypothetical protein